MKLAPALLLVTLGLSNAACGALRSLAIDGGPETDAGPGLADAATIPGSDLGGSPHSREGASDALTPSAYSGDELASCYDGLDNDGNGLVDCQDVTGCGALPSCCPGAGTTCCDAQTVVTLPDFASCAGTLLGCGLSGVSLFGTGLPRANTTGLYPGGDRTNEGGLVLATPLDRTQATFVHAMLALPTALDCAAPCIDTVALGLITDSTLGAMSSVRPVIALVASASLQEVMLVSGDVVLASTPVPAGTGAPFAVTLTYSASGQVTADVAGAALTATVPRPSAALHLAIYGHNENRSGVLSSRVTSVDLEQAVCDTPSVWATRTEVTIGAGSSTPPQVLEGPSVTTTPTTSYLSFAASDGIYVARRTIGGGPATSYALQFGYGTPDIAGTSLGDPDIHYIGDATPVVRVYFANRVTNAIEVVEADDGVALTFGTPRTVLSPSDPLFAGAVAALDGPSVVLPGSSIPGGPVLAVRAHLVGGQTAILLVQSTDGLTAWTWRGGDMASSTVTPPSSLSDPAHDEVASPSLVHRDGAWDLYYAGRTFARWSIGLMLSDDLSHWRATPSPVVLAGADAPSAFDAYSVRDPGAGAVDGDPGHIELFYAGTDGVTTRLGRVERAATTVRGP